NGSQFSTPAEQTAFRQGYDAGFAACSNNTGTNYTRTAYTGSTYRGARRYSSSRRAYYDYGSAPRGRTFWQKHREKLSLAIGTGAGAAIAGLICATKGAGIGPLPGLDGSGVS